MYWATFPFARVGIFFISGILLKPYFPEGSIWLFSVLLLLFIASFFRSDENRIFPYVQSVFILLMSFTAGVVLHEWKIKSFISEKLPETRCHLECILLENPVKKTKYRVMVKLVAFKNIDGEIQPSYAKLILYFSEEDSLIQTYKTGDKIIASGKITEISATMNPGAFDMKNFYFRKGITQQSFISIKDHERISRNSLGVLVQYTSQIREKWLGVIDALIPDYEKRSIIKALLLGYKNEVSDDVFQSFSQTGAIHVLAVSGLHIGAVLYLFVLVFRWVPLKGWWKFIFKPFVLIVIAILFVFLTGASPSVIRAAIMFSMVLIGKEWFRNANTINILFISAIWMLLYDPFLLYNLSFHFSYLSLLSIIIFYPYCKNWYIPKGKSDGFIWDLTVVSIAAQFLVFPMALYYFNQFPVYFIISSVVAIPLALLLVYSGFGLLILETLWEGKFFLPVKLYNQVAGFFLDTIRYIQGLPYSVLQNIWIEPYQVILLYCGIFSVLIYVSNKKIWHFYLCLFFIFCVYLTVYWQEVSNSGINRVCFYETRKGYTIDFIMNQCAMVVKNDQLSVQNEKFIASKNRMKLGVNKNVYLLDTMDYNGNDITKTGNIYTFCGTRFYILKSGFFHQASYQNADYLVVPPGIKTKPEAILSTIDVRDIILLSGIEKYKIEDWKQCATEYNIPISDLSLIGYYEISLNKKD